MAEAERYEDEEVPGNEPSPPPGERHLRGLPGGGDTSEPDHSWFYANKHRADSSKDLAKVEKNPNGSGRHLRVISGGGEVNPFLERAREWAKRRKKRIIISLSVTLATIITSIVIFISLLPFKLIHIMDNLERHFYASSNTAVTKETDNLFSGFLKNSVLPGLSKCARQSTVSSDCQAIDVAGSSPVAQLWRAWRTHKMEYTLANKYGTSFRYDKQSGRYYIKSPYLSEEVGFGYTKDNGTSVFLDAPTLDDAVEREVRPSEFYRFVSGLHDNIEGITFFQRVMFRFKMNPILAKYGGWSRCIIACTPTRDFTKESLPLKKKAVKLKIAQRVISPMSEQLGLIFQCLLAHCNLDPSTDNPGLNGEPRSSAEIQLQDTLTELASTAEGQATLESVSQATKEIRDKGWTRYAMGQMFAKAVAWSGGTEVQQEAAKELGQKILGPFGWGLFASQLYSSLDNADRLVKELGYSMNSAAYANTYLTYRTYVDECNKEGNCDAALMGSFIDSLGPGAQCDDGGQLNSKGECSNGEKQLGGTAGAEQTPLYSVLIDRQTTPTGSPNYVCKNGQPVPAGQTVCSEEKLDQGNKKLGQLHDVLSGPVLAPVKALTNTINGASKPVFNFLYNTVGKFLQSIAGLVGLIPGVQSTFDSLAHWSAGLLEPLFKDLASNLINIPESTNMSGGRTFDAIAAGNDVVGNDFNHHVLGGVELTDAQVSQDINDQTYQDLQEYKSQPFLARMFNQNSPYSLVSKVAMAMPLNRADAMQSIGSMFTNPFGKIASAFGSLFNFNHVYADAAPMPDPFGITQYGYPADDPIFSSDPETYWEQHCTDSHYTDAWNAAAAKPENINPDTIQAENPQKPVDGLADSDPKGTDPCLLIQAAVGSAGAIFDPNLLTSADLAGTPSGNGSNPSPGTLVWPFTTKSESQYNRVDQGWDIQDKAGAGIYAIAPGTLHVFTPNPGGFGNDYPTEELDQTIGGPSNWVYYGHVHIIPTLNGKHVNAGQLIAYANTTDPQNGSAAPPGWLEIGFAQPGTDAPVDKGGETVATAAGQKMKDLLINAQPAPVGSP